MSFADQETAAAFRDVVRQVVQAELGRERPGYKYATVQSIDLANRTCDVKYTPNDEPVTVKLGSIVPKEIGQIVRIAGQVADRYVDDVLGETGSLDVAAPDAPTGLTAVPLEHGLRMTWFRSDEAGLLMYIVQIATDVEFNSLAEKELTIAGNFLQLFGLSAGQDYFLRVRALDDHGNLSPWSAIVHVLTPSDDTGSVSSNVRDTIPSSGGQRTATLVVAAFNSSEPGKAGADFVCEGSDDHETINAAFAANSLHGKVLFLEGDYYCADVVEQNGVAEGVSPLWSTIHFDNVSDYWWAPSVSEQIRSLGFQGAPAGGQTRVVLLGVQVDVENIWVYGNLCGVAIEAGGGNLCTIRDSYVVQSYEGISLTNSAESEVRGCLLEQCSWGIISDSYRARIIGNRMRTMTTALGTGCGVQLNTGATESEVLNNYIADAGDGIYVVGSSLYRVVGNKIWGAQFYGLNIDGDETQLHDNYVEGASLAGNNTYDAIRLAGDRCSVQGNRCHYNGFTNRPKYGLHDVGTANLIINNDLRNSGVTASALLAGSTIKNLDGSANNWNLL